MNIGIDIDGVIADIEPYIFEYGAKLLYDKGRTLSPIAIISSFDIVKILLNSSIALHLFIFSADISAFVATDKMVHVQNQVNEPNALFC